MNETTALDIKNLGYSYHTPDGETPAIKNITFSVLSGEFIVIVGPSGCGKSTLLSLISGLIDPESGSIALFGESRDENRVAYMLQRDHLFDWYDILDNCLIGLKIQKRLSAESKKNVENLLVRYGLGDFLHCYPRQLSGGMRQRAALIRTLAVGPDILLLDEPFSALDYQTRLNVSGDILSIIKNEKRTAVFITHDISEAVSLADRIIVLSERPAEIKAIYGIDFTALSPIERRKSHEFGEYFNKIWKELET